MTTHTAIPTCYRGIQMRSRLEAKWACCFDQLGWTWEYEPFDLKGWIPDFLITNAVDPFVVEVKSIRQEDKKLQDEIEKALGLFESGDQQYAEYNCLILGLHPFWNNQNEYCIGWLSDDCFGDWYGAPLSTPDKIGEPFGVSSGILGLWRDRISGESGKEVLRRRANENELRDRWVEAHNRTQWKSPRR